MLSAELVRATRLQLDCCADLPAVRTDLRRRPLPSDGLSPENAPVSSARSKAGEEASPRAEPVKRLDGPLDRARAR